MLKFDEMWKQLPASGAGQSQSQTLNGMSQSQSQSQSQGVRDHYQSYAQWLDRQPADTMRKRREEAEMWEMASHDPRVLADIRMALARQVQE